ncbi:TGS domain-containing protein, partial [Pasteurella multocida]|uniref:TGS domain-containing protein n=1 Tax=Pasteurella multocida TaxID=747 RepID=UPI0014613436|nr:TGS domain-containing protein [Pasteurella multocida]NMR62998.1 TGS domain-containing protein [Pasteurella multocida]
MPIITLPDGSQRQVEQPFSVIDVSASICSGLAKACISGRVYGGGEDAWDLVTEDSKTGNIPAKGEGGFGINRHPFAHLFGYAHKQPFPKF